MAILQEVPETPPSCDQCVMHMPEAGLFNERQTERCNIVTERRLRRRYVDMADMCRYMTFSLYGGQGGAMVEEVETFKYMGRTLDQKGDDWPKIRQNIKRVGTVWGKLGKILRWEVADPRMVEMFYRAVAQAVQVFGLYTWVLSTAM